MRLFNAVAFVFSEKVQYLFVLFFLRYLKWISVKLAANARIGRVLEQQLHDIRVVILDSGNQSRTSPDIIIEVNARALLQEALVNASMRPSGDQDGRRSAEPFRVRLTGPLPSTFIR